MSEGTMDLGLRGRAGLVTGGSAGIGEGIALEFARQGVETAICGRTAENVRATAERITAETGTRVVPIVADVSSLEECERFVSEAAEALGRIDFLVNNAGASMFGSLLDLPDSAFSDALNGKLLACVRLTRAVAPHIAKQGGGAVVNITGATQHAVRQHSPGSIANAGVRLFSKICSRELAPMKIRVNSLAPGSIDTERQLKGRQNLADNQGVSIEEITRSREANIPSGRLGTPADIANMVCFLVSDHGSYVNGAALIVDGGASASLDATGFM